MINIGLTGNACSGYDRVSEIFNKLYDVPVFDADLALKFLLNYRIDVIRDIRILFGSEVYEKGLINPLKFNTTEKFDRLVEISEKELIKLFNAWKRNKVDPKNKYVIFKCAILFERGLEKEMDSSVSVFKPKNERATLLAKETGAKLMDTYNIVSAEMDELLKNNMSQYKIHNYDDLSLLTQVENISGLIMNKALTMNKLLPMISPLFDRSNVINITT
jgi:dephospho-CoA kinase